MRSAKFTNVYVNEGLSQSPLEVAGYLAAEHVSYLDGIQSQMASWGLREEFPISRSSRSAKKIQFLRNLDVLSVPSPYNEPKGPVSLGSHGRRRTCGSTTP